MKKYLILLLLLLSSALGFAQKLVNVEGNSCATIEATEEEMQAKFYYGNNDKLQEKYDSLAKIYGNIASNSNYRNGTYGGEDNIWFRIPIKFWIYQWTSANSLEYPERSVKSMIWALNDAYRRNNIPVRFFTSCYQFVENQAAASNSRISDSDVKDLMSSNKEFAAINIHIVNNPSSSFYAPYNNGGGTLNAICVRRSAVGTGLYPELSPLTSYKNTTFIHEIGHYFQLEHTHRDRTGPCKELVTRGRVWSVCLNSFSYTRQCEWRADALCDTEADPNLKDYVSSINTSNNCLWTGNAQDQRGDTYRPDTKNYMSYSAPGCMSTFTESQKAIMLSNIADRNYIFLNLWQAYASDFTDIYEPDNIDAMASPIQLNETQEHAFGNILSFGCPDNEDWVSYQKKTLVGDLLVEIEDVAGFNNPVLDVEFWESNGTDISPKASVLRTYASIVNQSGKRTYRVACGSLIKDNIYLFRVRRNGSQTGRYTVTFKEQGYVLSGQGRLCEGTNHIFTLYGFDVSQGTLTWLVSNGITLVSSAGNTATVVHSGYAGYGSVTARVTTPCGTKDFIQNLTLGNFLLLPAGATLNGNFNPVIGSTQVYTFPLPSNYDSYNCVLTPIGTQPPYPYQWTLQGCYVSNGQMTATVQVGTGIANVGFEVYMCGTLAGNFTWLMLPEKDPNCVYDFKIVYPNPTKESLTIERGQSGFCVGGMRIDNNMPLPYEIKLYDSYGVLKGAQTTKTDNITLNVANLPSGLYVLHIIHNREIQQKRIFLE